MTLRLILMRHAKSDWEDALASDHERILNKRGRNSCDVIGPWLARHGYLPDQVLCSDAARTQETWARLGPHLPDAPRVELHSDLYLAGPAKLLSALKSATGQTVAMLAHNPGIGDFASGILAQRPSHAQFARFPTLSTLVADFDIDQWSDLERASGRATDFIVPRDLFD